MNYTVLDSEGVKRYFIALGTGTDNDPYRTVATSYRDAIDLGNSFLHSDRHVIANNGILSYLLKTPPSPACIELLGLTVAGTSSPLYIDFYEDSIVSVNGSVETLRNQNRQSITATTSLLYLLPTVTDIGTAILEMLTIGEKNIGGQIEWSERIILKPLANYLFRIQNMSGSSTTVAITVQIKEN